MALKSRITACVLALLMCIPLLAACAGNNDKKPAGTTPSAETTAPSETDPGEEDVYADRKNTKDNLPDKMDFGGQDVRILVYTTDSDKSAIRLTTWFGEADATDNVSLETYERNERVMDRLNINIVMCEEGLPEEKDGVGTEPMLRTSVMSFSDDWDISNGNINYALEGWLLDIANLDYVDYDAPYWNASFRDAATFDDRLFYMVGSTTLTNISAIYVTYFNKGMWADFHTGDNLDLYQVVRDGDWTIEKMAEFCTGVYRDLDGDNLVSMGDQFGNIMSYDTNQSYSLSGGANLKYTSYDEDQGIYIWSLANDRTATFYEKVKKLLFQNNNTYTTENNVWDYDYEYIKKLVNSEALFTFGPISTTQYMRDMPDPGFGIVPPPKFDENQEKYTSYTATFEALGIPTTCTISDVVGATLEALHADSYRYVIGEYYDTAVKIKLSRDEDTIEMLDLAVDGCTFDPLHTMIGYVEWSAITVIPKTLVSEQAIGRGISMINKLAKSVNKSLEELPGKLAAVG